MSQGAVGGASRGKVFGWTAAVVALLCLLLAPPGLAHNVYVANFNSHDLAVIDSRTNLLAGPSISLPGFAEPFTLAITPDGSRAYVSNSNGDSLLAVDLRTNAVIGAPIPSTATPTASRSRPMAAGSTLPTAAPKASLRSTPRPTRRSAARSRSRGFPTASRSRPTEGASTSATRGRPPSRSSIRKPTSRSRRSRSRTVLPASPSPPTAVAPMWSIVVRIPSR